MTPGTASTATITDESASGENGEDGEDQDHELVFKTVYETELIECDPDPEVLKPHCTWIWAMLDF